MPWLAAVGAMGGSVASGLIQSGASDRATQAQTNATNRATDIQEAEWKQQQANQAPWLAAGRAALPEMSRLAAGAGNINPASDAGYKPVSGLSNPGQFQFNTSGANADPSYTWRLNQGLGAVNSSAAAKGGFFSGQTGTALTDYAQGAASQEYQNQFNRYQTGLQDYMQQEGFNADQYNQAYNRQMGIEQNQFNQYAGIAGVGQTASNQLANAGQNYATNTSNLAMNQGNNAATNATNQGNIWGGVVNNATNQFMSAWGQQQQQNAMNQPTVYGPQNTYNQFGYQ